MEMEIEQIGKKCYKKRENEDEAPEEKQLVRAQKRKQAMKRQIDGSK